jgi:hypothetical protein
VSNGRPNPSDGRVDLKQFKHPVWCEPVLAVGVGVLILSILFPPIVLTLPHWAFGHGQEQCTRRGYLPEMTA